MRRRFETPPRRYGALFSLRFVARAVLLLAVANGPAAAQEKPPLDMTLDQLLNLRVVAAANREQRPFDSPRSVSIVTEDDLRRRGYRSTPEALQELAGVMVQQTNDGAGSPILRGLIGNQVLLLIDGVRMNNAIYRLGPNQYLNTVDINQIERIEIIRGPGSILFGTDALGGSINIVTKSRIVGDDRPNTIQVSTRISSADRGAMGRVAFDSGLSHVSVVGGVSLKSFGQLRGGGDTVQRFTGYDEWAADLKVAVKPWIGGTLTFAVQHVNQTDVQRSDALQSGTDLEYQWDPETRTLASATYTRTQPFGFVRGMTAVVSYQEQSEHIVRRTAASPSLRRFLLDRDRTLGANVQFFSAAARHSLTYGLALAEDWVRSTRQDEVIGTGQLIRQRGTYADGARTYSVGAYLQDQFDLTRRMSVEAGVRFDRSELEAALTGATTGEIAIDDHNVSLVGSAYGIYKISDSLRLVGGVSQGFRSPNVDDVSILGSFGGGFEMPNPLLDPERSVNVVGGVKYATRRSLANVSVYDVLYHDLIARAPATYNDLPFLDVNANGRQDAGEPLVFRRQNIGRARVKGIEADGQTRLVGAWTTGGSINWTYGNDLTAGEPLRRIPPVHGSVRLRFEPGPQWWIEGYSLFAQDQERLNSADISDARIGPNGTPGFTTINVRGGVEVRKLGTITLGFENITDERYKWHGSGIERPGRSVVVGFRRVF